MPNYARARLPVPVPVSKRRHTLATTDNARTHVPLVAPTTPHTLRTLVRPARTPCTSHNNRSNAWRGVEGSAEGAYRLRFASAAPPSRPSRSADQPCRYAGFATVRTESKRRNSLVNHSHDHCIYRSQTCVRYSLAHRHRRHVSYYYR